MMLGIKMTRKINQKRITKASLTYVKRFNPSCCRLIKNKKKIYQQSSTLKHNHKPEWITIMGTNPQSARNLLLKDKQKLKILTSKSKIRIM